MSDQGQPVLSCSALTARYKRHTVLNQIDLKFAPGEWVGLIGPNGAGKSTLLKVIKGLLPFEGTVHLHRLGASNNQPAPCDVAYVPQSPRLPSQMSVAEYVLLGRTSHLGWLARETNHDREVVASVLARLDLGAYGPRPIDQLSGGETQRVVLARALAQQSGILLLDEPTSALDPGHQVGVLDLVDKLRRDDTITVVAAMHDLTTAARFADRLVMLHHGRVWADGPPSSVLRGPLLSEVYGTPMRVLDIDGELVVLPDQKH